MLAYHYLSVYCPSIDLEHPCDWTEVDQRLVFGAFPAVLAIDGAA
jgi:hypothetical protein